MKKIFRLDRKIFLGQSKGSGRLTPVQVTDDDVAPTKESMLSRYQRDWDSRTPMVNRSVIDRQIAAAVGQNWDAFRSRLLRQCRNECTKSYLSDTLNYSVETHAFLGDDGELMVVDSYHGLRKIQDSMVTFYVDPETRMLCRKTAAPKPVTSKPVTRVILSQDVQLHLVDGIWYHITLAPMPEITVWTQSLRDQLFQQDLDHCNGHGKYGRRNIYATQKRQLSRKELLQHGLFNQAKAA